MVKRVLRSALMQAGLGRLAGLYLGFALRSTRWVLHGGEHIAAPAGGASSFIVAFWHERLPLMPALLVQARRDAKRGRGELPPVAALVSRHADGRLIGRLMAQFSVHVVHGSTARGGLERGGSSGLRRLLAHLEQGGHAIITPDGPRGPRRRAAPGVAQLAALSGAPVIPVAAQTSHRRILRSWDRMVVPLPWGRGVLVCRPGVLVARDGLESGLETISAALDAACEAADRLCAASPPS